MGPADRQALSAAFSVVATVLLLWVVTLVLVALAGCGQEIGP